MVSTMVDFGDIKDSLVYGVIHFLREEETTEAHPFTVSLGRLETYYLDYPKVYINEQTLSTLEEKELSTLLTEYYVNNHIENLPSQHWDRERVDVLTKEEWNDYVTNN